MMPEFQVTRQSVTKCADCPAFGWGAGQEDSDDMCRLEHRYVGAGALGAGPPPEWCPLRKNPVQLVLLGTGWGEKQ
jgi:hypothetical protein